MVNTIKRHTTGPVPVTEPLRGDQVRNSAGGYVWAVDKWTQMRRFLILGSEGGTYYVGERELTLKNIKSLEACIAEDGRRAVELIVEISDRGLAPKNDWAIYALAVAASTKYEYTRNLALEALPKVCRTGSHLLMFAGFVDGLRGWGRALRNAVGNWYLEKAPEQVAYQIVKYAQRGGWSQRDLLRLSHPKPESAEMSTVFKWAVSGAGDEPLSAFPEIIFGAERIKTVTSAQAAAAEIRNFKLPREAVPTQFLNEKVVWEALAEDMPMTAMIRNLATMTRIGLIDRGSEWTKRIANQMTDSTRLSAARVHPMALLIAMKTYASGRSVRGSNTWTPVPKIVDALDAAFYLAFGNVEPVGKPVMLGLDVSGSMSQSVNGIPGLSCHEAEAAMALITANTEPDYEFVGFSHQLVPLDITPRRRLDDVVKYISSISFGATDASLPMKYATSKRRDVGLFVTYTDNETWRGEHPTTALETYRGTVNPEARSAVVAFTSTEFSIADPTDPGQMDLVGLDAAMPQMLAAFGRGEV